MLPLFSPIQRELALKTMQEEVFDLLIIGGGITGAGAARDAASRGMKVALVEANDFASGTSSRSSKLIHGGIRYLENLEFGLVFEALSERQHLFDIAPHLVHPLRFLIPIYEGGRVPAWKMALGMWVYDALSLFEAPDLHETLDPEEVQQRFPQLRIRGLDAGLAYSDAYMDDDRLVHETLRAANAQGATIANYVRATGAQLSNGSVSAVDCEDTEKKNKFAVKARHVISTVGPWTDRLGEILFSYKWKKKLRPSKGVHLTFQKSRFPLAHAVVMGAEKRIVFAIPRHEMVIVGTTDTDFPDDPANVRTEAADVEYILKVIADYFPGANITRKDIVGCYAGVRPLIDDGSQTESKTSREHAIWTEGGVTFVAGGKYTTYRLMAEQTVDEALNSFSLEERVKFGFPQTLGPLNPLVTADWLERARRQHRLWRPDLPEEITELAADRHGLEAEALLADVRHSDNPWEAYWCAEARHAVRTTMCLHLVDFYLRRTPLALSRADHGLPYADSVAETMAELLNWDSAREKAEINALQNQLASDFAATISG